MAEAITYADLRFVKKSVSSRLGQDPEAYEDGELTYENVQVPPVPGAVLGLSSSGLGDNAGVKSQQLAKSWSSVTSPDARRILPCPTACLRHLLLGLLLTCLLLGVAAICLGVRYLQVSQQLQQMTRVLEATNSSLRQQLRLKITQLGQKEEDLQGSRKELAQSQEALQEEQRVHQAAEGQLQACQLDGEKIKETLKMEIEKNSALEQRLNSMQETLKSFFTCSPPGLILKAQHVPRYKFGHGHTKRQRSVQRLFPSSVSGQLSGFQMGTALCTELDTPANKNL
ncbi:B-cell differentiation antigen CD72 isoform X2 [Castor canadensis]|uniref:B-cell differentiation antigen CD72 isoform X2 n=1 Tax=Castor canadensis TaxID=51338 RepID=A0AC58KRW3_CASCN